MRKIFYLLGVVAIFALTGCNGRVSFYLNQGADATIQSSLPISTPFNIPVGNVSVSSDSEFDNNNTTPDLIESVTLNSLVITITSPDDEDFSFLKSMKLYIKNSDDSNKQLMAYIDDVDPNATSITLTPEESTNLVPYLKQGSFKLETEVTAREALGHDVDIHIDMKFKVTAKVL